jgi:hypothetical protein
VGGGLGLTEAKRRGATRPEKRTRGLGVGVRICSRWQGRVSLRFFAALASGALLFTTTMVLSGCACENDDVEWSGPPKSELEKLHAKKRGRPEAKSADRLPPGALLEGSEEFYGFAVPRGMKGRVVAPGIVEITGRADFDLLASYTKDRIAVRHAEMLPDQLIFRNARILGTPEKVFDLTVSRQRPGSRLEIHEITKRAAPKGLSEEERWKRAGLRPSGGLIDPSAME